VGFSGVIFGLLVVNSSSDQTNSSRSIFGFFRVPTKFYPWALLILFQIIMPGVSFLGHLAGMLAGYLYVFGYLNKLMLPASILNGIESSRLMGWLVIRDGYISNPHLGSSPTSRRSSSGFSLGGILPTFRTQASNQTMGQVVNGQMSPQSTNTSPVQTSTATVNNSSDLKFPGTGQTLGNSS